MPRVPAALAALSILVACSTMGGTPPAGHTMAERLSIRFDDATTLAQLGITPGQRVDLDALLEAEARGRIALAAASPTKIRVRGLRGDARCLDLYLDATDGTLAVAHAFGGSTPRTGTPRPDEARLAGTWLPHSQWLFSTRQPNRFETWSRHRGKPLRVGCIWTAPGTLPAPWIDTLAAIRKRAQGTFDESLQARLVLREAPRAAVGIAESTPPTLRAEYLRRIAEKLVLGSAEMFDAAELHKLLHIGRQRDRNELEQLILATDIKFWRADHPAVRLGWRAFWTKANQKNRRPDERRAVLESYEQIVAHDPEQAPGLQQALPGLYLELWQRDRDDLGTLWMVTEHVLSDVNAKVGVAELRARYLDAARSIQLSSLKPLLSHCGALADPDRGRPIFDRAFVLELIAALPNEQAACAQQAGAFLVSMREQLGLSSDDIVASFRPYVTALVRGPHGAARCRAFFQGARGLHAPTYGYYSLGAEELRLLFRTAWQAAPKSRRLGILRIAPRLFAPDDCRAFENELGTDIRGFLESPSQAIDELYWVLADLREDRPTLGSTSLQTRLAAALPLASFEQKLTVLAFLRDVRQRHKAIVTDNILATLRNEVVESFPAAAAAIDPSASPATFLGYCSVVREVAPEALPQLATKVDSASKMLASRYCLPVSHDGKVHQRGLDDVALQRFTSAVGEARTTSLLHEHGGDTFALTTHAIEAKASEATRQRRRTNLVKSPSVTIIVQPDVDSYRARIHDLENQLANVRATASAWAPRANLAPSVQRSVHSRTWRESTRTGSRTMSATWYESTDVNAFQRRWAQREIDSLANSESSILSQLNRLRRNPPKPEKRVIEGQWRERVTWHRTQTWTVDLERRHELRLGSGPIRKYSDKDRWTRSANRVGSHGDEFFSEQQAIATARREKGTRLADRSARWIDRQQQLVVLERIARATVDAAAFGTEARRVAERDWLCWLFAGGEQPLVEVALPRPQDYTPPLTWRPQVVGARFRIDYPETGRTEYRWQSEWQPAHDRAIQPRFTEVLAILEGYTLAESRGNLDTLRWSRGRLLVVSAQGRSATWSAHDGLQQLPARLELPTFLYDGLIVGWQRGDDLHVFVDDEGKLQRRMSVRSKWRRRRVDPFYGGSFSIYDFELPDGTRIGIGGNQLRIGDAFRAKLGTLSGLDCSADGRFLAVQCHDKTTHVRSFHDPRADILTVPAGDSSQFTRDGLFVAIERNTTFRIVDPEGGRVIMECDCPAGSVHHFSYDGSLLAYGGYRTPATLVDMWSGEVLETIASPAGHKVRKLAISPDAQRIAIQYEFERAGRKASKVVVVGKQ